MGLQMVSNRWPNVSEASSCMPSHGFFSGIHVHTITRLHSFFGCLDNGSFARTAFYYKKFHDETECEFYLQNSVIHVDWGIFCML